MSTKAEREELRKNLGRIGRSELLQLLLAAWAELDTKEPINLIDALYDDGESDA